jgi:hypothetical protein
VRVAHLASFQGNIGDQLSHLSFRKWFESLFQEPISWRDLEIRDSFRGIVSVREMLQNSLPFVDMIVIGGGNFWELWPRDTATGTSIDLSVSDITSLGKPVFFNSLGIDTGQGVSAKALNFPAYLEDLLVQERFFVTVRNDGAIQNMEEHFGWAEDEVRCLPDHGFFAFDDFIKTGKDDSVVAINFATDMPKIRFSHSTETEQLAALARGIEVLDDFGIRSFRLVPHIWRDLEAVVSLLSMLPDRIVREKIDVEALSTTSRISAVSKFQAYESASMVIATRFHSNVAGIATGSKLLPIVNYPQINRLLDNLPYPWSLPLLSSSDLSEWVPTILSVASAPSSEYVEQSLANMSSLRNQRAEVGELLKVWLGSLGMAA